MNPKSLLVPSLLTAGAICAGAASAQSVTDPAHSFGVSASHSQYKVDVGFDDDKDRINKGGLFYNWGNKLTGAEGFIYQIGADAQYGEEGHSEVKSGRIELDLGARAALSTNNYIDFVVGAGYDWDRFEYDGLYVNGSKTRVRLDNKTPQVKAGLGYNYLNNNFTARLEAGTRYSLDGRSKVKVGQFNDTVDMEDKFSPYAELSVLWNKGIRNIPVITSLYFEQTRSEMKGSSDAELKQDEFGLRVGLQL